jgi:pimeloyl-ACP methyl ester carboxylesterase
MPTTSVDGATVHYTTAGEGPALVFVAGTGLAAAVNFGHLVDGFTDRRTVVLPDYAGSGETTDPGDPLTVELLAAQIAGAAADASGGEPVDLVGFSLGAVIAAAVAATRPELIRRLVLVAGWPAPDARMDLATDLWARLEQTDHGLFNRFLQVIAFSPPFLSAIGPEGVAQLVENGPPITAGMRRHIEVDRQADIRALLPDITAPTLVIGLTRDYVVPVEQVRLLHQGIAGSQYAEIDTGHVVVFERPEEFVGVVRKFLLDD